MDKDAETLVGVEKIKHIISLFEGEEKAIAHYKLVFRYKNIIEDAFEKIGGIGIDLEIIYRIKLLQKINPGIFTRMSGAREMYKQSSKIFLFLVEDLNKLYNFSFRDSANKSGLETFVKFLKNVEKDKLNNIFTELWSNLHRNLKTPVEEIRAEEFEIFLTNTKSAVAKVIGAVEERLKQEERVENLKDEVILFTKAARNYKINSWCFLGGASLLLIFLLFSLFTGDNKFFPEKIMLFEQEPSKGFYLYLALKTLISDRILVSTIFVAGFFYCVRFYAASNHNVIICEQRANMLASFKALYIVSNDDDKTIVLEKILDSITASYPTGFSKLQKDTSDNSTAALLSKIFSIMRKE